MCYSAMVKQSRQIALRFNASESQIHFNEYHQLKDTLNTMSPDDIKNTIGFARTPKSEVFPWGPSTSNSRIYPGYFAPVITLEDGQRIVRPMRYRVRPRGTPKEIPTKYNLFNCRLDAITTRKTWKPLFGKQHAIFPFVRFYEWVERDNKKREVSFYPFGLELMWAPALYDTWTSENGQIQFSSFALITDEPPPEVLEAGHDRCPIFLKESFINDWLTPEKFSQSKLLEILYNREKPRYGYKDVIPD